MPSNPRDKLNEQSGLSEVLGHIAKTMGVQALSGIKGLSMLPHGMDAAADAINEYQRKYSPGLDLSQNGQDFVRNGVAPVYNAVVNSPLGKAAHKLSSDYGQGVQEWSDLAGKYLGANAAGAVGAVGDTLPMAIQPNGILGKEATQVAKTAPELMRAYDGSSMHSLQNEGYAARQANGAAISVNKATDVGHPQAGLIGYHPDALVIDAHDPSTMEHVGRLVAEPSPDGSMLQGRTADVFDEANRSQGIGTKMLKSGVDHAHSNDMDWGSDVKLSPGQVATYMKLQEQGYPMHFNPTASVADDKFLTSGDGKPVLTIPKPTDPDTAEMDEPVTFNPNSYIQSQAHAEGGLIAEDIANLISHYAPKELAGMPKVPAVGNVPVPVGPNPVARQAAANYMQEAGIRSSPQMAYAKADPARGKAIADAFEAMKHDPDDPVVKASYEAMMRETLAQYQHMKAAGVNVEFMPPGQDPYAASPRLMAKDVAENNHMYVFPTESGFGSGEDVSNNPLLAQSGETFNGVPATHNDIFRAVHDYFGHVKEGVGFRADGEENAWNQHARMYSDLARPAMTTETRGQNSWVNFGPHAETNRTASGADTIYAPQKTGLLPSEYSQPDDGMMHFLHMSNLNDPEVTLDPKFYGTGMKGAESRRGGTKTVSLYPWDIDPSDIEGPLQSKTPYHVAVPKSKMYDMSNDPAGLRLNSPSFSDAEDAVKDAGYLGYYTPTHSNPLMQGQARMFGPTAAVRIGEPKIGNESYQLSKAPRTSPANDSAIFDDTADTSDFARGGAIRYADGGEIVGPALDDLGALIAKYAAPNEHAAQLATHVADNGAVTYNPTSGEIHSGGYAVPTEGSRSVSLDSAPTSHDIHDFMLQNQDAFDANPKAALHVESDEHGNHFMHVAHVEPDFEGAMAAANASGAPGIREIHTGTNFPTEGPASIGGQESDPLIEQYLSGSKIPAQNLPGEFDQSRNERPRAQWTPGQPTVENPQRTAFPGIYNDPRQVIEDSSRMVGPEDPLLQRLFGVSRQDLSDIALSRQGNELGVLPGAKLNPRGAKSALGVMTPQNEQRLIDVLTEARGTPLYTGMTGWYAMDPLYQRFRQIFGDDLAPQKYARFNSLMGMASPGSDVGTEIARGTSANWLHNQGRFEDFRNYAGIAESDRPGTPGFPADMMGIPGHPYHSTAQAVPMADYLRTGALQMKSPKVPMYIGASGVPEIGFQTDLPVGDAHWSRGVGLADTRNPLYKDGKEIVPGASVSTPEMQTLAPWWRDRVAAQAGYQSVPAQATAWGAFAPYTGVESQIGAPKLEILSTQIGKLAQRLGVSPEAARDLIIEGKAGAF